jgi:chorismate mutase
MGILGDAIGRRHHAGELGPTIAANVDAATAPSTASAGSAHPDRSLDLLRRRDALAEQVTELHWDLGGLAYEMAIRDHFRLDVIVRRAALLQERDAELAEVERLLRSEENEVAGSCPSCTAPHSRGAVYCWQCGTTLMERLPSSALAGR